MNKAIKDLVNGVKLYPVWLHQAWYALGSKYKRTVLGTLWIAGNFVFTSIAITVVFGALFHQDLKTLLPYTMLGNLCATMCLWAISEAPELFVNSSSIIRNHAYPFTFFSFEAVARLLMLFGHNIVVYYVFMAFNGTLTIPHWSVIPGLIIDITIMLTWGTVIGMLSARYRDLRFLLPNLSSLLYFLTPVYWHVDQLGKKQWIAEANPLYNMINIIRSPLLGEPATSGNWLYTFVIAAVGILIWLVFFSMFRRRIPFWV